jgi:hypothetical protein
MAGAPRKPTNPNPPTPSGTKRSIPNIESLSPRKKVSPRPQIVPGLSGISAGRQGEAPPPRPVGRQGEAPPPRPAGLTSQSGTAGKVPPTSQVQQKAMGGKLKMVEKGGKKVPAFAADGIGKMAKGGKVSEYGGKEMYKSKAAMMKHEGKESKSMEKKEAGMAKGGKARGMGAATKGGNFSKNG